MERVIAEVRKHYGKESRPKVREVALEHNVRAKLRREFSGSDTYIDSATTLAFLGSCGKHTTYQSKHITLHVITCVQSHVPRLLIHRVLKRAETIMRVFGQFKGLTIWLVPSPALRHFPQTESAMIHGHHINGGFTYPALQEIYIHRMEEFPKVVLHEVLHHMPVDVSELWDAHPDMVDEMYRLFDIDRRGCPLQCHTVLRPNEAVVEAWADLFQIAFVSIEYHIPWRRLYAMETSWVWGQVAKIMEKQRTMGGVWKEGTHAYSYIVLRAFLLSHVPTLLALHEGTSLQPMLELVRRYPTQRLSEMVRRMPPSPRKQQRTSLRMTILGDL